MNRRLLAMLLLCLALVAAACGGEADDAAEEAGDTVDEATEEVEEATDDVEEAADPTEEMTEADPTDADPTDADPPEATTDDGTEDESAAVPEDDWPDQIVIGFVPSREADVIIDSADDLAAALAERLGIEAEAFVSQDYTALTEAMGTGQADIGAFGPLGIVRAQERFGVEFILQSERFGSATYHTQYMTNDPDTYCLDEVVTDDETGLLFCNGTLEAEQGPIGDEAIALIEPGTTLAYVDPTSTSGYLIPALQMIQNGVDIDALDSNFSGGHDSSALAVDSGQFTIGLSFDDVRTSVLEDTPEVAENVVVFAYSQEIPNDGFVVRADLPDSLKEAITEAMLDYASTEEGTTALQEIYEIDAILPADDASLDDVRAADEELGDTIEDV